MRTVVSGKAPRTPSARTVYGSLSEQATLGLLKAVLDGEFSSNRLPAEPVLAEKMGVSRTTIRAALYTLDRLGVISRAPGRGTLLRPHVGPDLMLLHRFIGFRGALAEKFEDISIEQKFTVREPGDPESLNKLGIGPDVPMLVNDKTFVADGRRVVHIYQEVPLSFVNPSIVMRLLGKQQPYPETIFEFSKSWPGHEIDHSVVEFVPRVVPRRQDEAFPLPLQPGTPYLEMQELHYSESNEPIAYSRQIFDDQALRFKLVRPR